MRSPRAGFLAAGFLGALLFASPGVALSASSAELGGGCTYDQPSRLPYWTVSGTWDDGELLLVDAAANEIIRYSANGRALGTLKGFDSRLLGPMQPSQIARTDGGFVLQLAGGRFAWLDADRSVQTQQAVLRESRGAEGRIDAVRLWAVAGDDLVFCGDTVRGEGDQGDWRLGFFRAPFGELGRFQELARFDGPDDAAGLFCRLGYPYVTAIGDTAYFLKMDQAPKLYAAKPGEEKPRHVDEARFPARPNLPNLVTAQDFPTVFRVVERSRMAAGLFAFEGRLYVLIREPRIAGTRWMLHELDPETGRELGKAEVPSTANHLLVVPGPKAWAFVEKGEVQEVGVQDVAGILRVPAGNVVAIRSLGKGADLCGRGPRVQGIAAARQ